jgi:4-amino-4-deoxy-L-arabinose transferase-like glycosyltransferase
LCQKRLESQSLVPLDPKRLLVTVKLLDKAIFLLVVVAVAAVWLGTCLEAPGPIEGVAADEIGHASVVLRAVVGVTPIRELATQNWHYPPLFYFLSTLSGKIFGTSRAALAFPNLLLLIGSLLLLRVLAARLYGPRSFWLVGPLTAVYLTQFTYVITTEMSVVFCALLFAFACLELQSKSGAGMFVLLGAATLLALLSRTTAPAYLAVPFVWLVWVRRKDPRRIEFFAKVGVSLLAGCAIAILVFYRIWFLYGVNPLGMAAGRTFFGMTFATVASHYLATLRFWFLPVLIMLVVAAVWLRRNLGAQTGWLLAAALVPMAAMVAIKAVFAYHLAAAVPFLLLAAIGPAETAWKGRPAVAIIAVAIVGFNIADNVRPVLLDRADLIMRHQTQAIAFDAVLSAYFEAASDPTQVVFAEWGGFGSSRTLMEIHLYTQRGSAAHLVPFQEADRPGVVLVSRGPDAEIDLSRCYTEREWELWSSRAPDASHHAPPKRVVSELIDNYVSTGFHPPPGLNRFSICERAETVAF